MSGAKVSRRAVLAAGVLLAAAGCARKADAGSRAELVWLTGGISTADQGPAGYVTKQWNQQHPDGPKVRVQSLPPTADEQRQVLALELNAGLDNFDIFDLDVVWTADFARHGWLADLQDLRSDIDERTSLRESVRSAVWDGRLWAAPYVADMGILYYRSDLVDTPPSTWEDLVDVGLRVGERNGIAPFVADGKQYEGLVVQYLEYFWGLGGEVFGQDGRVLDPYHAALDAANHMRTWFSGGVYAPGFNTMDLEEARKTFQSGNAVFMRLWPYAYQPMKNDPNSRVAEKVGIAPLPMFRDHPQPVAALGGHHLAVSPFSRNLPAAKEFVKFVSTSRDMQRELAQQYSRPPTLASTYDELAADPMMELLKRVLPTVKARPETPDWTTISIEMQQQIFAAYTGGIEPAAAVRTLQDFLGATVKGG